MRILSLSPLFSDPRVLTLLVTFVGSFALTGFFAWYARRIGMMDLPGERHSHQQPTPRGGGAGIVIAVLSVTLVQYSDSTAMSFWIRGVLPGFAVLALIGWWDDRVSLRAGLRFLVQLVVSLFLVWSLKIPGGWIGLLLAVAALGFVIWMTNLYNFMDGSNGMAGCQGVFAGLVLGSLFLNSGEPEAAFSAAILALACLGFLPWNLGNARVFMGDVGSGSLGFAFASLLLYGVAEGNLSPAVAWLVMLVFLCDSSLTLMTRVLKGERWYTPHKQHLYQQLIVSGWSHGLVLSLYQGVNLVLLVPAIAVAVNFPALAPLVAAFTTLLFGSGWLLARRKLGVLA